MGSAPSRDPCLHESSPVLIMMASGQSATGVRFTDCSAADEYRSRLHLAVEIEFPRRPASATNNGGDGFQSARLHDFRKALHGPRTIWTTDSTSAPSSTIGRSTAYLNNLDGFKVFSGAVRHRRTASSNTQDGFENWASRLAWKIARRPAMAAMASGLAPDRRFAEAPRARIRFTDIPSIATATSNRISP